ncbi:alpha-1,6-mannanase [Mucilaginibacter sp. PAMC 26640]|nr:alpha-1,6-mannanase [Mucilaginibacter sp. PAMC 26640]
MIKLTCILNIGIFISTMNCVDAQTVYPKEHSSAFKSVVDEHYGSKADLAYESFNTAFYNPEAKLYYSTTKKAGVAAIWTQAVYWDMAMDVYERRKTPDQLKLIEDIYQGNYKEYDGYNWNNKTKWFIYDDIMWWVVALARANKLTGKAIYLEKAKQGFDHVWAGSYDPVDCGMFWDFKHSGKNSCINFPTVIAAIRLYTITGDTSYLNKAKLIYGWSRNNLVDSQTGQVFDNKIRKNPPGGQDYTYNSGTAIGAAFALYKATSKATYLNDAKLYTNYVKNILCTNAILPAEASFNEQGVLKSIFAQYVMQLIKEGGQTQYLPWIQTNINTGWKNRDTKRNLTYRDYRIICPEGEISSYDASSIVTFMQLCPPVN